MRESTENFLNGIEQSLIKCKFKTLESDYSNIEDVYKNNLNIWYYFNSDIVTKKDGTKEISSKIDTINKVVLLNHDNFIFSKKHNGFELTEVDFINNEFKVFESLIVDKLNPIAKKQFDFYTMFLSEKRSNLEYTLNDYYNHYIKTGRFGFTICRTYKSSQFDELLKRLNETKKRYDYIFSKLNDNQRIEFKYDFCDNLQKLKTYQTESKNIEIIQTLFLKINDEYNHYHRNSKLQIDEYKSAIVGHFEITFNRENENKTPNSFYYYNQIRNFVKDKNNYVKTNIDLKKHTKELVVFNGTLESILLETFTVFESAYKYNIDEVYIINSFNMSKFELIENLKSLKSFRQSINVEIQNRKFESAILLENYCVNQFKSLKSFLNSHLFIDIDKSPLKSEFDEVLTELENSIDINKIQILMKSNVQPEIEQPEPEKIELENESIRENFNPNHFNFIGYDLFCYLIDNYNKKGIVKYINIYYFMRNEVNKNKYSFNFIQKDYTIFIQKNYKVTIKKYEKAKFDFDEQKRILNALEEQFRTQSFK